MVRARSVRSAESHSAPGASRRPAAIETGHADLHRSVSRPSGLQGAWRAGASRPRGACSTTRRPVDAAQFALAARAWSAYRSPDPRAIEALLKGDTSALPFLAAALARHLEEFPSDADGLSRSERRMLEQALDGPAGSARGVPADARRRDRVLHRGFVVRRSRPGAVERVAGARGSVASTCRRRRIALPAGTIALTAAGRDVLAAAPIACGSAASIAGSAACTCRVTARPGAGARARAISSKRNCVTIEIE